MKTFLRRKVDELGRVVLPQDARKALNLSAGDAVKIAWEEDKIVISKLNNVCRICGAANELNHMGICQKCIDKIKAE